MIKSRDARARNTAHKSLRAPDTRHRRLSSRCETWLSGGNQANRSRPATAPFSSGAQNVAISHLGCGGRREWRPETDDRSSSCCAAAAASFSCPRLPRSAASSPSRCRCCCLHQPLFKRRAAGVFSCRLPVSHRLHYRNSPRLIPHIPLARLRVPGPARHTAELPRPPVATCQPRTGLRNLFLFPRFSSSQG